MNTEVFEYQGELDKLVKMTDPETVPIVSGKWKTLMRRFHLTMIRIRAEMSTISDPCEAREGVCNCFRGSKATPEELRAIRVVRTPMLEQLDKIFETGQRCPELTSKCFTLDFTPRQIRSMSKSK